MCSTQVGFQHHVVIYTILTPYGNTICPYLPHITSSRESRSGSPAWFTCNYANIHTLFTPYNMPRDQVCGTLASGITSGVLFDTQSAQLRCVRGSVRGDAQAFSCALGCSGYNSPNCRILKFYVCSARTKGEAVALKETRPGRAVWRSI